MSAAEIRRRIKDCIDQLSADRLAVVEDFLSYLRDRESNKATDELLRIPGFLDELQNAEREVMNGDVTPARELRDEQ